MRKEKFNWPTAAGPSAVVAPKDQEVDAVVALQPQRIRLYSVEFHAGPPAPPASETFLQ